ncbi:hypothetical protein VUR80DRAFT_4457 [Thermomyces stellatus]
MAPYNWPRDGSSPLESANPFRPQSQPPAYHSDDEAAYPRQLPSRPKNPALPASKPMTPASPYGPPHFPPPERTPAMGPGWFEPPKVRIRSASVAHSSSMYSTPPDWFSDPSPRDRPPFGPPCSPKDPLRTGFSTSMFPDILQPPVPGRVTEAETDESTVTGFEPGARPTPVPRSRPPLYKDLGDREIRLVRILPERMSALRCELIHVSLDKPPKYVAVSYARGDPSEAQTVQVDGTDVPISTSLHGALKALRRKSGVITVWADALCINQDNGEERTRQVQHMKDIYSRAQSVAVWLGPEGDASGLAMRLLNHIAHRGDSPAYIRELIGSKSRRREFDAVVRVFERDYWTRLWIVQEIANATAVDVYCGPTRLPFNIYKTASKVFLRHKEDIAAHFPPGTFDSKPQSMTRSRLPYADVLGRHGPAGLPNIPSLLSLGHTSFLHVLQSCRNRHTAVPQDKVFGVLGLLPEEIRDNIKPDYSLSVRDVYINVVDYLLTTTSRLDVICESIHYPSETSTTALPSWTPDWSHITLTNSLGLSYDFKAAGSTKAKWSFKDHRSKLCISAVFLDVVKTRGIAVGPPCCEHDYLMAFMHWRALLLGDREPQDKEEHAQLREVLCRTLCAGQIPTQHSDPRMWSRVCYQAFASVLREKLRYLSLDRELTAYANSAQEISITAQKRIVGETCGGRMKGRCLFTTQNDGLVGMGTGSMAAGDIVVVPLGCYSPVILRPEGPGLYRFVGDVYVDGYMYGEAIDEWEKGRKELDEYVLC